MDQNGKFYALLCCGVAKHFEESFDILISKLAKRRHDGMIQYLS